MGNQVTVTLDTTTARCWENCIRYAQHKQKRKCDQHVRPRSVSMGDDVFVRNYSNTKLPWMAGKVVESTGPISAKVALDDEKIVRRHLDQINSSNTKNSSSIASDVIQQNNTSTEETPTPEIQAPGTQTRRYPTRERRKPRKLDDYEL